MKVSVIVPVYNVEKYLDRCLKSLVNQTMNDYEVIVVNDGSQDTSWDIIMKYQDRYPFIKGFEKENGGISSARNFGLQKATGEYIAFVDSDDFPEPEFLEKMYNKIISDDSDVVICDYYALSDNEKRMISCHPRLSDDIKKEYLLSPPMVWSKMIKKTVMDNVKFKDKIFYEDLELCVNLFKYVNKISFVDEPLYNYFVWHSGSAMTQKKFSERLLDIFTILEDSKKKLQKDYFPEIEYIYITHLLRTATLRFLDYPNTGEYLEKINMIMEKEFPNWRKNVYYVKASRKVKLICFFAIHKNYFMLKLMKKMTGRR